MKLTRLRGLREDADLSQSALASILGISQRALSYYESGSHDIPTDVLIRVADYFHCSTDYILERTNRRKLL